MIYKEVKLHEEGSEPYARLCLYIQERSKEIPYSEKRKMVLICPGGGYYMTSDRESEAVAIRIMSMGYHAAVLRYSVSPARYPTALLEVAKSMSCIRENASEWNINVDKICIMGFSAGGHLAASYGVFWTERFLTEKTGVSKEMLRPNAMILCYPVITSKEPYFHRGSFENLLGDQFTEAECRNKMSPEDYVNADTPKCFIWNTCADEAVPPENAMIFAQALLKQKIPVEYHLFEKGCHGLSLADEQTANERNEGCQPECQSWANLLESWLKNV